MKKQVISILFAIILIFTIKSTCNAASATISCDANATVGKEITISANVTGVMWNLELKVNGETRYTTRGDANAQDDEGYITNNNIVGVCKFRIAYIGYPSIWLRDMLSN